MKKLLVTLLAASMCLSMLAGCGSDEETTTTDETTTSEATTTEDSGKQNRQASGCNGCGHRPWRCPPEFGNRSLQQCGGIHSGCSYEVHS